MNKERRKRIGGVINRLAELEEILDLVIDEEQEAYANLPEEIQVGEKGDLMMAVVTALEEAIAEIQTARTELENAVGK